MSTSPLHRFWTDFGLQIGANMEPKSTPNPPKNNDFARKVFPKSIPELKLSSQYISYYDLLVNIRSASIMDRLWAPNWCQHGAKIHPKSIQKQRFCSRGPQKINSWTKAVLKVYFLLPFSCQHPFRIDFGPILDPKPVPTWSQNPPQIHPETTILPERSSENRFLD